MLQSTLPTAAELACSSPVHPETDVADGIHYRKIHKLTPRTRNSAPPAWAWQHGQTYGWLDEEGSVVRAMRCHHCSDMIRLHEQRVSNFTGHMKIRHEAVAKMATLVVSSSVSTPSSHTFDARQQGHKQLYFAPEVDKFRRLLVRWCVEDHVAFAKVDTDAFKDMMLSVNPLIKPFLCSRVTLARWIEKDYLIGREAVKLRLKQALSKKHISFDIWSAPAFKYSFVGVVAHCVVDTEQGPRSQSIQLALRRIKNKHDGDKLADILLHVIREYDILPPELGAFMADNAETNDKAVRLVLNELQPGIKQKEITARRARCVAHIINLAAQAFLFGKDVAAFEDALTTDDGGFSSVKVTAAQDKWRKQGAIGKLHNIVQYIFSSSGRRDAWSDTVVGDKDINGKWTKTGYTPPIQNDN